MKSWFRENYEYYFRNRAFPTISSSIKSISKLIFYWKPKFFWERLNYSGHGVLCNLCRRYQGEKPLRLWRYHGQEGLLKASHPIICHYNPKWVESYKGRFDAHRITFVYGKIHLNPYHRNNKYGPEHGDCEFFETHLTYKILRKLLNKCRCLQFFLWQKIFI